MVADHAVHVQPGAAEHLLPAEHQQLPGQLGRPLGALLHQVQLGPGRVSRRQFLPGEVQVAQHRLQDVVEIVGDAPGQLAHRLQLLGLAQLVLQLPAQGDVPPHADDRFDPAVLVEDGRVGPGLPAPAVAGQGPLFEVAGVRRLVQLGHLPGGGGPVVRVHQGHELASQQLVLAEAEGRAVAGADVEEAPLGVDLDDHVAGVLDQHPVAGLAVGQALEAGEVGPQQPGQQQHQDDADRGGDLVGEGRRGVHQLRRRGQFQPPGLAEEVDRRRVQVIPAVAVPGGGVAIDLLPRGVDEAEPVVPPQRRFGQAGVHQGVDAEDAVDEAVDLARRCVHRQVGGHAQAALEQGDHRAEGQLAGGGRAVEGLPHAGDVVVDVAAQGRLVARAGDHDADHPAAVQEIQGLEAGKQLDQAQGHLLVAAVGVAADVVLPGEMAHGGDAGGAPRLQAQVDLLGRQGRVLVDAAALGGFAGGPDGQHHEGGDQGEDPGQQSARTARHEGDVRQTGAPWNQRRNRRPRKH